MKKTMLLGLFAAAATMQAPHAWSQDDYPSQTITIVVPYTAGGATDIGARIIAQKMGEQLDTTVIVENRPGAGGVVGTISVAKAAPDGYTLLYSTIATHAVGPALRPNLEYDALEDFEPVSKVGEMTAALLARKDLEADNLAELIALAKDQPGTLNIGSTGVGTSQHLAIELFKSMAGVEIEHIPYGGSAPALVDLMAGNIDLSFDTVPATLEQLRAGTIKAITVSTTRRSEDLPDVPTMIEAGLDGFDVSSWAGLWAPAGTPDAIVEKLNEAATAALEDAGVADQFGQVGIAVQPTSPADFDAFVRADAAKWKRVVQEANITLEE